jgi:hypothetical protein
MDGAEIAGEALAVAQDVACAEAALVVLTGAA